MSSSNLKTIKVNPIFLSTGSGNKNKTRKEKPAPLLSLGSPNNIKKKLIARIKNFQKDAAQTAKEAQQNAIGSNAIGSNAIGSNAIGSNTNAISLGSDVMDDFSESVQFLDNLAREKQHNKTLKKKQVCSPEVYMQIATELPPELAWGAAPSGETPATPLWVNPHTPLGISKPLGAILSGISNTVPSNTVPNTVSNTVSNTVPNTVSNNTVPNNTISPDGGLRGGTPLWSAPPAPYYSNLKNGGKPTYRTWLRNTQKNQRWKPPQAMQAIALAPITESFANITLDTAPLNNITLNTAPLNTAPLNTAPLNTAPLNTEPEGACPNGGLRGFPPQRKRITRTLKYKLGKHANGKVSVLIKNAQTRRKVQSEQALLKQKSILDVKNYLRSKNLLKVGSEAPNDVLRQTYEQSILAGIVENKAKDVLLHNYFNEEK